MNNYSNNKLHDPHGFKEEVKIKYNAVKLVGERSSNGTAVMMALIKQNVLALIWVDYYSMVPVDQFM